MLEAKACNWYWGDGCAGGSRVWNKSAQSGQDLSSKEKSKCKDTDSSLGKKNNNLEAESGVSKFRQIP